jgi:hypothetical protein
MRDAAMRKEARRDVVNGHGMPGSIATTTSGRVTGKQPLPPASSRTDGCTTARTLLCQVPKASSAVATMRTSIRSRLDALANIPHFPAGQKDVSSRARFPKKWPFPPTAFFSSPFEFVVVAAVGVFFVGPDAHRWEYTGGSQHWCLIVFVQRLLPALLH